MKLNVVRAFAIASATSLCLAACGGSEAPATEYKGDVMLENGMTVAEMIESRQHNLKDLGGAFKTINDQLKLDEPNVQEIAFAAAEVNSHGMELGNWFPEGTGPESGVETDSLASIWEKPEEYAAAVEAFKVAAADIHAAAQTGDLEVIGGAVRPVGMSCKGCHDNFRLDDD